MPGLLQIREAYEHLRTAREALLNRRPAGANGAAETQPLPAGIKAEVLMPLPADTKELRKTLSRANTRLASFKCVPPSSPPPPPLAGSCCSGFRV